MRKCVAISNLLAVTLTLLICVTVRGAQPEAIEFFEKHVRPVLVTRCLECHGEKKQEGGLRLDSKQGWQTGGDSGSAAIVPGKPEASLLIKAVGYADIDLQMPPDKQLKASEVAALNEWIRGGAIDPRTGPVAATKPASDEWAEAFQKRLDWWSLQPLIDPQPPAVSDAAWSREPVDRFIRARLDTEQLSPAASADRDVLLRRLSFVLTGLPPATELRENFIAGWSRNPQAAYIELVDTLLKSPHFGERFARHWMDVVRYTDTYGYEWDNPAKGSWEYRDYLIRAFNADIGFDQFLTEQLAGDLLPQPRIDRALGINESLIGPMFYHLGEHRHGSSLQFNGVHQEMINNKIDAFSKAFLATTVACARCHDHKLEAVSQRDYYGLAAVFITPRWTSRVVDAPGKNAAAIAKLRELRSDIRSELTALWRATAHDERSFASDRLRPILESQGAPALKLDDVAYPLTKLLPTEANFEKEWRDLAAEWRAAREARQKANAKITWQTDFSSPDVPSGWVSEGEGFDEGYVDDGAPLVALEGDQVIARLLPRGYHTHALSSKLPGALRSPPEHAVPGRNLAAKLAAGYFGGYLVVEGNAFQNETVKFLENVEPAWTNFADMELKNGVSQVTVEFATAPLNPNFPPRTGLGGKHLKYQDLGYDKRSWLSITGIATSDSGATPAEDLEHLAPLLDRQFNSRDEAWQHAAGWLTDAVRRWCDGAPSSGDVRILNWLLANKLLPNQAPPGSRLTELLAEYRAAEAAIEFPRTVNSMDERDCRRTSYALNVRGNVDALGDLVAPDFLSMFAGRHKVNQSAGSGRLELAHSLVHPEHPLTSRVYVNRVWQWVFGAGLVATPDDFGRLGDKPSHPELLDYLARDFVREGWSTKKLIRRFVLSQTFQQSSVMSDAARQRDPGNRLLHHYSTRRLEAEAIRDAMLAVSGRLDPALFGRPIESPRAKEDAAKRLFSGPVDGNGRRSLYLKMSIMDPPKFLVGFNLPDLKLPTGRRDVTNVPTQSLIMLNDPLVVSLSKRWGDELVKQSDASAEARIRRMFVAAFARGPRPAELERWTKAARELATSESSDLMIDAAAWQRLAHAFYNAKEFIYYR